MTSEVAEVESALRELAASPGEAALARLVRLGPAASEAVRRHLAHHDWKVRRDCLRFLDHCMDPASAGIALELLRGDESPEVRKWAAHALGCDRCKSGPQLGFDPVPALIACARTDPSLRVRRSAVVSLAWTHPPDARIHALLSELLASESDPRIRHHCEHALPRHARGPGDD